MPPTRLSLFPLLILALLAVSSFAHAATVNSTLRRATVLRVSDGDTIAVRIKGEEVRIRLYGIDAPEKNQPGGAEATAFLEDLLLTNEVMVKTLDVDKYGREVAVVSIIDGCNLLQVQQMLLDYGLVWVYDKYCRASFCKDWKEIEVRARENKAGIWAGEPVEPWVWRKK